MSQSPRITARPTARGHGLDTAPVAPRGTRFYVGRRGEGVWVVDRRGARALPHLARWSGAAFAWRAGPGGSCGMLELAAALLEHATGARPTADQVGRTSERLLELPAHAFVLTDDDLRDRVAPRP